MFGKDLQNVYLHLERLFGGNGVVLQCTQLLLLLKMRRKQSWLVCFYLFLSLQSYVLTWSNTVGARSIRRTTSPITVARLNLKTGHAEFRSALQACHVLAPFVNLREVTTMRIGTEADGWDAKFSLVEVLCCRTLQL